MHSCIDIQYMYNYVCICIAVKSNQSRTDFISIKQKRETQIFFCVEQRAQQYGTESGVGERRT